MSTLNYVESERVVEQASYRQTVEAGDGLMHRVNKGETLRLVDVEGNQAADILFYNADNFDERYSAQDTIMAQQAIYLTTGTTLMSTEGNPLLTIVADTCGRHDTLGGACSRESNTMRYGPRTLHMHACRDTFLLELSKWEGSHTKRDITCNINFFMNVPVTAEGGLKFDDGVSAPGRYVEMVADMDIVLLLSNCPQLNNPCNAYNPTPVEVVVWES